MRLLEGNPQMTQRELSDSLGISLGKVNFCLKALKEKGYLKWQIFSNNSNKMQYFYLLTPSGVIEKGILTIHFLRKKQEEFDVLKQEIETLGLEVKQLNQHALKDII